jgi:hypothetical protein
MTKKYWKFKTIKGSLGMLTLMPKNANLCLKVPKMLTPMPKKWKLYRQF